MLINSILYNRWIFRPRHKNFVLFKRILSRTMLHWHFYATAHKSREKHHCFMNRELKKSVCRNAFTENVEIFYVYICFLSCGHNHSWTLNLLCKFRSVSKISPYAMFLKIFNTQRRKNNKSNLSKQVEFSDYFICKQMSEIIQDLHV